MKYLILAVLILFLLFVGTLDYRWAKQDEAQRAEYASRMNGPIRCDAYVAQRGAGEKWVTRCYIKGSNR